MTERKLDPFVDYLQGLARSENRAALAALRQGFNNPLRALPYVAPFFSERGGRAAVDNLILLGGLFSLHPETGAMSLASAMRRIAEERKSDSIELRFRGLLDCDREDLPDHLRHAVSLAAGAEVPIDFDDLLRAIRAWNHESRFVQRAWARQYWSTYSNTAGSDPSSEPSSDATPESIPATLSSEN